MLTRHRYRKHRKVGKHSRKHSRKHPRTFRRKNRVKRRRGSLRRRVMRGGMYCPNCTTEYIKIFPELASQCLDKCKMSLDAKILAQHMVDTKNTYWESIRNPTGIGNPNRITRRLEELQLDG